MIDFNLVRRRNSSFWKSLKATSKGGQSLKLALYYVNGLLPKSSKSKKIHIPPGREEPLGPWVLGTCHSENGNSCVGALARLYDSNGEFVASQVIRSDSKFYFYELETGSYVIEVCRESPPEYQKIDVVTEQQSSVTIVEDEGQKRRCLDSN